MHACKQTNERMCRSLPLKVPRGCDADLPAQRMHSMSVALGVSDWAMRVWACVGVCVIRDSRMGDGWIAHATAEEVLQCTSCCSPAAFFPADAATRLAAAAAAPRATHTIPSQTTPCPHPPARTLIHIHTHTHTHTHTLAIILHPSSSYPSSTYLNKASLPSVDCI